MLQPRLLPVLLAGLATGAFAQTATNPPPATSTPDRPPTRFSLAEGFRMELVATDQLVESPAGLAFDERGRLYVAEQRDVPSTSPDDPLTGRIRLLEDTDGDGVFDTATVFAEQIERPAGLACSQGGVFATSQSEVLYLRDTDGDGAADIRRALFTFVPAAAREGAPLLPQLTWRPDRRLHVALGGVVGQWQTLAHPDTRLLVGANEDISFHPLTLEVRLEPGGGGSSRSFNHAGEQLACSPWTGVTVAVHEAGELERNPFTPPLPAHATLLPSRPGWEPVACLVYRGGRYASKWQDALFLADPQARTIRAVALEAEGLHARARPGSPVSTLAASDDILFRPVALAHGPDDAIYIADLCRTGYPHSRQVTDRTHTAPKGRIWRLGQDQAASLAAAKPDWTSRPALAASLGHTNAWVRDTAARLLLEQRATNMAPVYRTMLQRTVWPVARLEALRALEAANLLTPRELTLALSDKDPVVRAAAARMAGALRTPPGASSALFPQLQGLTSDPSPRVQFAAGIALGHVNHPATPDALARGVLQDPANPWLHHVALTAWPMHQGRLFALLLDRPAVRESAAGQALLRELALTLALADEPGAVSDGFAALREQGTDWAPAFHLAAALAEGAEGRGLTLAQADREGQWVNLAGSALAIMLNGTDPTQQLAAAQFVERCVGPEFPAGQGITLLFAPGLPEALLPGFIRTLAREGSDAGLEALTQRWEQWSPSARQETVEALLQTEPGRDALVRALGRGTIPAQALTATQFEVLRVLSTPEQKARLGGILAVERPNRDDILKEFLPTLEASGNAARGRQLFEQRCVACHHAGPASLGPDPSHLAQLSRMQRLAGLLDPSRALAPQHATTLVTLKDGRTVWGVVRQPNPAVLHVVTREGLRRYRPGGISGRVGQDWSLMPVNVAAGLSREDVTDLLECLGQGR